MTDKLKALAMRDPAQVFSSPAEVLGEKGLSRLEKIDILRRWQYDAHEIQVADEEGFAGPGPGKLLDEVIESLHLLGTGPDVDHSPPTKQGSV
ncbi:MAG: hypothetical protein KJO82_06745 [Gammaproteobacteria bacterium]|nr:hypothetical protein [Gammaproteobacteria bacterium]